MRCCVCVRKPRNGAYSLPELMVVLAICALLLRAGMPSFGAMLQSFRASAAANDFQAALSLARAAALQRGTPVVLVPADAASSDWRLGWAVIIDRNDNQRLDVDDEILSAHGPVPAGMHVVSSMTDNATPYITYSSAGRTRTRHSSYSPQTGTISIFAGAEIRRIKINFLGRARQCNPAADSTCTGAAQVQ